MRQKTGFVLRRLPFAVIALAAMVAGCAHGGSVGIAPHVPGGSIPTPTPTPGVSGGAPTAAQINTALQGVWNAYQTLPHTSVQSDLTALANQMTSSGTFSSATVMPDGISATFPSGLEVIIAADQPDDLAPAGGTTSAGRRAHAVLRPGSARQPLATPRPTPTPTAPPVFSAPTGHAIAFLVNESGDEAFTPSRQMDWGNAFRAAGFSAANGYAVDVGDINLENIAALGAGRSFDYLDISTHGIIDTTRGQYYLLSTTKITDEAMETYAADLVAKRVTIGLPLVWNQFQTEENVLGTFLFTPDYLTAQLHFNPGAIVVNTSCNGQQTLSDAAQVFRQAGVGRYFGWSKKVGAWDADVTDAYFIDRLLGEQNANQMSAYVFQQSPPQRPFPMDQIQTAMTSEVRKTPLDRPFNESGELDLTYAQSFTGATLIVSDFGGEQLTGAPVEYALPSIARIVADEPDAQLDIFGRFPSTPGTVTIAGVPGTVTLAPRSWTTSEVVVTLPASGPGSNGLVTVTAAGIASNAVPLTEWTGTLTYGASGSLASWGGDNGSGSFNLQAAFNVAVRADVHPTVVTIDATPAPQAFAFTGLVPTSNGALTAGSGTFQSDDSAGNNCKNCAIVLGLASPQPVMAPNVLGTNQVFLVPEPAASPPAGIAVPSAAPGCNAGVPGVAPSGRTTAPLCAYLFFNASNPVTCSGTAAYCSLATGPLSDELGLDPGTDFLAPSLTLTIDPVSYAVTVAAPKLTLNLDPFGEPGSGTATIAGTFQSPFSPPTSTTAASHRRR